MLIKVSVAGASGAFVFLVVNLIQTLHKGMDTLSETNRTLGEVRNAVHGLTQETKALIHTANQITVDVQSKMKTVDPLLESAQDVGEMIHTVTNSVKQAGSMPDNELPPKIKSSTSNGGVQIKIK